MTNNQKPLRGFSNRGCAVKRNKNKSLETTIKHSTLAASLFAAGCGMNAAWAQAQLPTEQQRQQFEQQSRERVPAPLPRTPNFDLRIQAPEKSALPKSVEEIQFEVKGFEFEGMSYFSTEETMALFQALVDQKTSLEAVRNAADQLEKKYRDLGFFLTRVFIPPQQVKDGVFKIRVIEGYIGQVFVEGPSEGMNNQITQLTAALINKKPLDLATLERVLLLINDIPGASGSGVLRQGAELGTSDLVITAAPSPDSNVLTFSNTGSNSTGPLSLNYNGNFQQPFGQTGSLNFGLTGTGSRMEEVQSAVVRYSNAIGGSGLQGSFGGLASRALPGGSAKPLDIRSDSYSISPRLRYPLQRSRSSSVYVDLGLSVNRSFTTLAGQPLSNSRSSVAELTGSWALNGWLDGTQNFSVSMFKGTGLFTPSREDAPLTDPGFTQRFTKYVGNFTRTQTLPNNFSLQMQVSGQYLPSDQKLAASESVAFGGPFIGRGFDAAHIAGDRGVGGLLELRYDSAVELAPTIGKIQFYGSFDHANAYILGKQRADGQALTEFQARQLTSKAVGMRFPFLKDNLVDLQVADAHRKLTNEDARRNPRFLINVMMRF
jgi:hemolysin activation/secretion protein